MAGTANAACESCRFFDDHKLNGANAQGDEGLCRFNPPVSQPAPESTGRWPGGAATEWGAHFTAEMPAAE